MDKNINELYANPINIKIYGEETISEGFIASIKKHGVMVPLVIKSNGTIISGHRRWTASKLLNILTVPVSIKDFDDELDEKQAILEFNKQREKTFTQKMNEGEAMEEIEKARAEKRMKAGKKIDPRKCISRGGQLGKKRDIVTNNTDKVDTESPPPAKEQQGRTRDIIAKNIGMGSGIQYEKAKLIMKKADKKTIDKLDSEEISIGQAFKEIKSEEKSAKLEIKKQEILKESAHELKDNRPTIYNEDCLVFLKRFTECDLLITDPPYSTDIKDIESFVDMWLYKALDKVKSTGRAYIFIGAYPKEVKAYLNTEIPKHMTLEQILIWEYKNTLGVAPKDRYILGYQDCLYFKGVDAPNLNCPITNEQWAVQSINAPDGRLGNRYHTWQKPLMLAERFIRHSTKKGDIVLDPFTCTGTFVIAANSLGRVGYGCDIDKTNLDIAVKRGCKLENI